MFTGLIEKTSKVKKIEINDLGAKIYFEADFFNSVKIGDSICVNGCCLTVTKIENNLLSADIMKETLNISNLKNLKSGDIINLERAMKLSDRLDGHLVSGHVDCIGVIQNITLDGFSKRVRIKADTSLIIKKGSIALNGVSLTVSDVQKDNFEVSLIPETINNTNLKNIKIGDIVNIEYDLIGKYVQKFLNLENGIENKGNKGKITLEFLKENGF